MNIKAKESLGMIVLSLMLLLVTGCTGVQAEPASPAKASKIVCSAAYRASTSMPIEREESITFEDAAAQQTMSFGELDLHANYWTGKGDGERSVQLWVSEAGGGDPLISQLYQLPLDSGPQNQFVGGHGFTGLNYVYHPTSGAELQFWCQAE